MDWKAARQSRADLLRERDELRLKASKADQLESQLDTLVSRLNSLASRLEDAVSSGLVQQVLTDDVPVTGDFFGQTPKLHRVRSPITTPSTVSGSPMVGSQSPDR